MFGNSSSKDEVTQPPTGTSLFWLYGGVDPWLRGWSGLRVSRHVLTTVAVAVLSLSVLGPPVQAQDNQSAQELADLSALAEAGDTEAQYSIGVKYDTGDGVPQDDAEAVIWYRRAAEQGHAGAQYSLGRMYDIGRGAPQDDAEAVRWYPPGRRAGRRHRPEQPRSQVRHWSGRAAGRR